MRWLLRAWFTQYLELAEMVLYPRVGAPEQADLEIYIVTGSGEAVEIIWSMVTSK
jgi:hypothetical protein